MSGYSGSSTRGALPQRASQLRHAEASSNSRNCRGTGTAFAPISFMWLQRLLVLILIGVVTGVSGCSRNEPTREIAQNVRQILARKMASATKRASPDVQRFYGQSQAPVWVNDKDY